MDEIFNILSSSARIDKSKRKKTKQTTQNDETKSNNTSLSSSITPFPKSQEGKDNNKGREKQHSSSKLKQIQKEEIAAFRNKLGIHLSQSNRHDPTLPDPISSFMELSRPNWWDEDDNQTFSSVRNTIVKNVERGKWINPTPIQMQAVTALLASLDA